MLRALRACSDSSHSFYPLNISSCCPNVVAFRGLSTAGYRWLRSGNSSLKRELHIPVSDKRQWDLNALGAVAIDGYHRWHRWYEPRTVLLPASPPAIPAGQQFVDIDLVALRGGAGCLPATAPLPPVASAPFNRW